MGQKTCNNCNTYNPVEAVFCRHCGTKFIGKAINGDERMGYLSVQSSPPKAIIWIDKERRGWTPLKVSIREGQHKVYITKGGLSTSQTVYVRRNETSFITAHLDDDKSQSIYSSGKIYGQAGHDKNGIISIRCSSPASIWIDGAHKGQTPLRLSIAAGVHKVYAVQVGSSTTYFVTVRSGEISYVHVEFRDKEQGVGLNSKSKEPTKVSLWHTSNIFACLAIWLPLLVLLIIFLVFSSI